MRGLSELLAEHARTVRSERVSLADIANFLGTRSIGAADHRARRIAELLPWYWQPLEATRAAA
jgi:hypothetical protein